MYFPNYLRQRYALYMKAARKPPQDNIKISEIIEFFKKDENFYEPHLFFVDPNLHWDELAEEALCVSCTIPEIYETFRWISKKIFNTINVDNYLSTNVYIRIGTDMLNKLVYSGKISKELNIYYHDNLVANVASLLCVINTEDLPF